MLEEYDSIFQELNDTIKSFIDKLPELLNGLKDKIK